MGDESLDDRIAAALPLVERIVGFGRRRNRLSPDDAEDFASYVRLKLVERGPSIFGGFAGRAKLETYLSVIVQRMFLDFRAARPRDPIASSDPALSPAVDVVADREDLARASDLEARLRRAILGLPDQDRVIVRLHFLEGMRLNTVAELLSLRPKPLYRRVERILQALRDRLEADGLDAGQARTLIGRPEFGIGWGRNLAAEGGNTGGGPSKQSEEPR